MGMALRGGDKGYGVQSHGHDSHRDEHIHEDKP